MYVPHDTTSADLFPSIPRRVVHEGPRAYAMYLGEEDELIGYARTYADATLTLNEVIFEQLAQGLRPGPITLALEHEAVVEAAPALLARHCGLAA